MTGPQATAPPWDVEPVSDPSPGPLPVHTTDLERHSGVVSGVVGPSPRLPEPSDPTPRRALEQTISAALRRGDCVVQFSGGRDSSLVLAVAAHCARREGLPLPTALAFRYPGVPSTQESRWQDRVIEHLGVPFEPVEVDPGGDELVAPLAVSRLLRDGATFPPAAAVDLARVGGLVGGRTVLTGQGGDEILGDGRVTAYATHWRRRQRPGRAWWPQMAREVLPPPARRRLARRRVVATGMLDFLRADARAAVLDGIARDAARRPWDWRLERWRFPERRLCRVGFATMAQVARREGFRLVHPLVDRTFIGAVCASTDRWGPLSRTEAMRRLGDDLLPDDVLSRQGKASFNAAFAGAGVRGFARTWTGRGVDPALVDIGRLREVWGRPEIPSNALAPLQLAVLAAHEDGWRPTPVSAP